MSHRGVSRRAQFPQANGPLKYHERTPPLRLLARAMLWRIDQDCPPVALRSRYVQLANGLDNVRFNGGGAGCYPVPAHDLRGTWNRLQALWDRDWTGEPPLVRREWRCSRKASDEPSIRMPIVRLLRWMTILAPLRIEERDALHNEKVRPARMRGGERIGRR